MSGAARGAPSVAAAAPSVVAAAPFIAAAALSAFLLFAVEPLVGRLALPAFGGAPAAWATVLLSFQVAVLIGYAYAHLSTTRLGARRGGVVHLVVLGVAIVVLVIAPERFAQARIVELPPALDLLRLLTISFGLPAIALAASTPLLTGWLASLGRDPIRLYAVSNGGSLAAVIAYPFLLEPLFGLAAQRVAADVGLVVLLGLFGACALAVRRTAPAAVPPPVIGEVIDAGLGPARVGRWLLLAAVPAGLLAAVTNLITTDLAAAPLLWIGPLGVYLLTLVVAFAGPGPAIARRLARWATVVVALLVVPYAAPLDWPVVPLLATTLLGFLAIGLILHGELAADRPPPQRLTAFYLAIAGGGAIGGAFVALIAPIAFDGIWEYPILLVGALLAIVVSPRLRTAAAWPFTRRRPRSRILDMTPAVAGAGRRLFVYLLLAGVIAVGLTLTRSLALSDASAWLLVGAVIVAFGGEIRAATTLTVIVLAIAIISPPPALFRDRSFFGVSEVVQPDPPTLTVLRHGTTVHSIQATDPVAAREPAGYFSRTGPLGDVVARLDGRRDGAPRRVYVIGLGAGTIASYGRRGDTLTFVEIDPLVVRIARDADLFTYLRDAPSGPPTIVVGDGRLELEAQPPASEELVVLDAFSSDAMPIHLMTTEALAAATRTLTHDGLLAVNISSRSYALGPTIAAGVAPLGLTALERLDQPTTEEAARGITTSDWVVAVLRPDDVAWFTDHGWTVLTPAATPFTDDRSDIIRLLRPDILW